MSPHSVLLRPFYFINLKETSKNSVQSLYYLFTKAGVLSLRNMGGQVQKKVEIKNKKYKMNFPIFRWQQKGERA